MRICLFEDQAVADLEPLGLTRPVFDLLCGLTSLSEKQARYFAASSMGAVIRPFLAELANERHADLHANDPAWLRLAPVLMVNARWLPPEDRGGFSITSGGPCVGTIGGEVAYALVEPADLSGCTPANLLSFLDHWKSTLPRREAGGCLLTRPWDLLQWNGQQIIRDVHDRGPNEQAGCRPMDFALVGPVNGLWIDPTARLDPLVAADTTNGPVVIDRGAEIGPFTRLEGPCYVGAGTRLMGATVRAGTSIGPMCRVGGEVEESVLQGFSNKYHDGFLGHSWLGEWVNIGAGAQTSDLRHDYGEVVMTVGGLRVPTGQTKVGSLIGDHAKIGVGCLLNTGTNIGVFAGVLPSGRLLPRYVPSFCAVEHGSLCDHGNLDVLLATAEEVMRRRGARLSETLRGVYRRVWEQTALQRRQALRDAEPRRLRRSA
jgi:UDP-N-acetylglucosamine diphosphorylase/glucosamine-1-phosphate N-acetyltransferase